MEPPRHPLCDIGLHSRDPPRVRLGIGPDLVPFHYSTRGCQYVIEGTYLVFVNLEGSLEVVAWPWVKTNGTVLGQVNSPPVLVDFSGWIEADVH